MNMQTNGCAVQALLCSLAFFATVVTISATPVDVNGPVALIQTSFEVLETEPNETDQPYPKRVEITAEISDRTGRNATEETCEALHGDNPLKEMWMAIEPPLSTESHAPKLAILALTKDRLHNPQIWREWLDDAKADSLPVRFFVHTYGLSAPSNMELFEPPDFREYVVNETAPTDWCKIFDAMMVLVRQALADPEVTHLATVSADAIPVKPVREIYSQLREEPATRMCPGVKAGAYGAGAQFFCQTDVPYAAETWWVMRREDAIPFRDNETLLKQAFGVQYEYFCQEESMFWEPLRVRHERWGTGLLDSCTTYINWDTCFKAWPDTTRCALDATCNCPALLSSIDDPSKAEKYEDSHPTTFLSVSDHALGELQSSPFWFARKFADGAIPE